MPKLSLDLGRVALSRRRTKIVATVGPASQSAEVLERLVAAGVDVFRLNFSHGNHQGHREVYERIRAAEARAGRPLAVLADLCGPKIRTGAFKDGSIQLEPGAEVVVTTREVLGEPGLIPSEYAALATDVRVGHRILLDDGRLELSVLAVAGKDLRCRVVHGGRLSNRKGMNLPGVSLSVEALTPKDKDDALFAARLGVDFLALSFVRRGADVRALKELLAEEEHSTKVVAKIEKPEALEVIDDIFAEADAIMVARGDLGVEMPAEEVPLVQQELLRLCRQAQRPVIVATQMLESMVEHPRPTRAEVSDVASAAFGQTDAVMLSAETASGRFPVEAVATMDRVLRMVEGYQWKQRIFGRWADEDRRRASVAVSRAASLLARDLEVRAVVVPTKHGGTARFVSSERPPAPVVALSHELAVCRRLTLLWGVTPQQSSIDDLAHPDDHARALVQRLGMAEPGQTILLVWDADPAHRGAEPSLSVLTV